MAELLTRDLFLASVARPQVEAVKLPGIEGLHVRVMTAGERDAFEGAHARLEDKTSSYRARVIIAMACDAEARRLFTAADTATLDAMPSTVTDRIVEAAMRLNKIAAADIEEARKN